MYKSVRMVSSLVVVVVLFISDKDTIQGYELRNNNDVIPIAYS